MVPRPLVSGRSPALLLLPATVVLLSGVLEDGCLTDEGKLGGKFGYYMQRKIRDWRVCQKMRRNWAARLDTTRSGKSEIGGSARRVFFYYYYHHFFLAHPYILTLCGMGLLSLIKKAPMVSAVLF
ncbi:hypothetical protein CDAR_185121 [Caerostris darwini]|uniref:Uncharacterized protein n=1 Tax=Caerostris darwini TaxID=1538125 RepID=A0AAV4SQE0_9ARAC|nr:hypothetical protein CDAR_185121 [Caerostris darwini]